MKVLVTGATGSLGRMIVRELLNNHIEVVATAREETKARDEDFFEEVEFIPFDFNDSTPRNLFDYFGRPDALIHSAWQDLGNFKSEIHLETHLPAHQRFLENLLSNGLRDFTGVGTCYECGLQEGLITEKCEGKPTLPYAIAKNNLRQFASELCDSYAATFRWARIFYIFGEVKGRKNLYTMLNEAIEKGEETFNMSAGEQIRDFLTPAEVARCIVKIALQKEVTGIINCCSGRPVKLRTLVEDYINSRGVQLRLNLGYYPYPDYEPMEVWGSTKKLDKILKL